MACTGASANGNANAECLYAVETKALTLPGFGAECQAQFNRVCYMVTEDSCTTNKAKNERKDKQIVAEHGAKSGPKPKYVNVLAIYCDTHGIGNVLKAMSALIGPLVFENFPM